MKLERGKEGKKEGRKKEGRRKEEGREGIPQSQTKLKKRHSLGEEADVTPSLCFTGRVLVVVWTLY